VCACLAPLTSVLTDTLLMLAVFSKRERTVREPRSDSEEQRAESRQQSVYVCLLFGPPNVHAHEHATDVRRPIRHEQDPCQ
jgi:hypothetical protein